MTLFALPFAAAGTAVIYFVAAQAWHSYQAASWPQHPATLLEAKLKSHQNDGSTTYTATARYEYRVGGQRYESNQVAFSGPMDNVGSFQKEKGRELERLLAAGGGTTCYLNPDDPANAVLYPEVRVGPLVAGVLFGLVFALVGYGLIAGAWYANRKLKREAAARAARPDEPWAWRDDWAAGRIRSGTRSKAIGATVFALFWNLISWPAIIGVLMKDDREWWLPLVVAAFPLIGIVMAGYATRLWLVVRRSGRSEFEMAAVPGVLGGRVAGVIHAPAGLEPEGGFQATLACIRKIEKGSGDDSHTVENVLWSDARVIGRTLAAGGDETAIPVQFYAPYQLPASAEDVIWRLSVLGKTGGVDYQAEFELPVFKTADSSSAEPPADQRQDALAEFEIPMTAGMIAERLGARLLYEGPDETAIYFPMAHNRGMTAFLVAFAIGWTGICVGLFYSDAPWFFPWIFSAFGVLIDYFAIAMLLRSTRLQFGQRGVQVHRRWLVFGQPREIPADDIERVAVESSGTSSGSTQYQRLLLHGRATGKVLLVNDLADKTAAEKLAALVRERIGLSDAPGDDDASHQDIRMLSGDLPDELD